MNNRKPLLFANFGGGLVYIQEILSYHPRKLKNGKIMGRAQVRTQTGTRLDVSLHQLVISTRY